MKNFKTLELTTITHGKITLASISIVSRTTGEVFEATGCAKCSPEDEFNKTIGETIAVRRALNKVGNKAYKATLRLAEKMRLDAEKMADHAMDEAHEICARMDELDKVVEMWEKADIAEQPIE